MTAADVTAAAVVEAAQEISEESVAFEAILRAEQYAERYSELERRVAAVFESAFVSTHSVETEVKLTKNGIAVAYIDLLLTARDPSKMSYVVEVKAAREMLSDLHLDRAQLTTGQSAIVAASLLGREVSGIVFVVLTSENTVDGLEGESRPVVTDDPRNNAGTFMVSYDILLRWENRPDGLRRFIEG